MNKLSVTTAGVLAGSTALLLLGMALERAKTLGGKRSPMEGGGTTRLAPGEGPEAVAGTSAAGGSVTDDTARAEDAQKAGPWPFPTAEGYGPH